MPRGKNKVVCRKARGVAGDLLTTTEQALLYPPEMHAVLYRSPAIDVISLFKIMNTTFDALGSELAQTHEQLANVRAIADETNDPTLASTATVLEESALEVYGAMSDIVAQNPSFTDICVRALQRTEVIDYVLTKSAEHTLSDEVSTIMGKLATGHSAEKEQLEAYFTLFAPEHPAYIKHIQPDVSASQKRQKTSGGREHKKRVQQLTEELLINDKVQLLTELEALTIMLMHTAQAERPGEKLKAAVVLKNEAFVNKLNEIAGKQVSYGSMAHRFQSMRESLLERFPEMFIEGGIRGGAWIIFNTVRYSVSTPPTSPSRELQNEAGDAGNQAITSKLDGVSADTEAEEIATVVPEKTWGPPPARPDTPAQSEAGQSALAQSSSTRTSKRRRRRERGTAMEVAQTTSSTRLLEDGYMIDRRITPYTDVQRRAMSLINGSPRKSPCSPGFIAAELRAAGYGIDSSKVDTALKELAEKLPEGWLFKVPAGDGRVDGWRLGRGVRIRQQHGTHK